MPSTVEERTELDDDVGDDIGDKRQCFGECARWPVIFMAEGWRVRL